VGSFALVIEKQIDAIAGGVLISLTLPVLSTTLHLNEMAVCLLQFASYRERPIVLASVEMLG